MISTTPIGVVQPQAPFKSPVEAAAVQGLSTRHLSKSHSHRRRDETLPLSRAG